MRSEYDRHELEAEKISTVQGLKPHLCSAACKKNTPVILSCYHCETGCAYGNRLLDLSGLPIPKREQASEVTELLREEKAMPTFRQRTRNRYRGG